MSADGTMSPVIRCSSLWHNPATFHSTNTSLAFGGSIVISSICQSRWTSWRTAALVFIAGSLVDQDAADVLAVVHVVVPLVDLLQRVLLGDQAIEVEQALGVQLEQLGDVLARVGRAEQRADQLLLEDRQEHGRDGDRRLLHRV